jgi:hypothetical protein
LPARLGPAIQWTICFLTGVAKVCRRQKGLCGIGGTGDSLICLPPI